MSSRESHLHVEASARSDRGCHREVNEDRARVVAPQDPGLCATKGLLLVVADGMGGHASGEVASELAVDTVHRAYHAYDGDIGAALVAALEEANRVVFEQACRERHLNGMGTTCTVAAVRAGEVHWAHVGDSRLYLVRGATAYQLTEDDSEVQQLVRRGLLSREAARRHPDRNVLVRALGRHPDLAVSSSPRPLALREGDRLVVVSDGASDLVADDELAAAAGGASPVDACERIVDLARARGGFDNITVVVAAVEPAGTAAPPGETRSWQA